MPDESDWIREDDEWFRPEEDPVEDDPYDDDGPDDEVGHDDGGGGGRARAWVLAAVLVLVLGAGVASALALMSDDDDDGKSASEVDTDSSTTSTSRRDLSVPGQLGSSSTTASSSTSSTVGVGGTGGTGGTGGGQATTSTTKKAVVTTTSTLKEDTDDPKCSQQGVGDAGSDPKPIKISFCVEDGNPKVGQTVKIHGSAVDPDSQIEPNCIKVTFDDEEVTACQPQPSPSDPIINREFTVTHVFTTPGDHTIHAAAASDPPHGSIAATSLKITVHA